MKETGIPHRAGRLKIDQPAAIRLQAFFYDIMHQLIVGRFDEIVPALLQEINLAHRPVTSLPFSGGTGMAIGLLPTPTIGQKLLPGVRDVSAVSTAHEVVIAVDPQPPRPQLEPGQAQISRCKFHGHRKHGRPRFGLGICNGDDGVSATRGVNEPAICLSAFRDRSPAKAFQTLHFGSHVRSHIQEIAGRRTGCSRNPDQGANRTARPTPFTGRAKCCFCSGAVNGSGWSFCVKQ